MKTALVSCPLRIVCRINITTLQAFLVLFFLIQLVGGLALAGNDFEGRHTLIKDFEGIYVQGSDLDGDGDMDIIGVANDIVADNERNVIVGDSVLCWWENLYGDGSSWTRRIIPGDTFGIRCVQAADLDGDGDMDLAVGIGNVPQETHSGTLFPGGGRVLWIENLDGLADDWELHSVHNSFNHTLDISTPDLDGDGDLDLLATGNGAEMISWWENNGTGTTWHKHNLHPSYIPCPTSSQATDLDGDGDLDVVASLNSHSPNPGIVWYENIDSNGIDWVEHAVAIGDIRARICSMDIDLDGDMDIISTDTIKQTLDWWENMTGDGTDWKQHSIDLYFGGSSSLTSVDFDSDGDPDILCITPSESELSWWENTNAWGTAWVKHVVDNGFGIPSWAQAVDINGDGSLDIVGASSFQSTRRPGEIAWWPVIPDVNELN